MIYNPDEPLSVRGIARLMEIGFQEVGGYIALPADDGIDELRAKGYGEAGAKVLFHKWGAEHSFKPTDDLPKIYYRLTEKGREFYCKQKQLSKEMGA